MTEPTPLLPWLETLPLADGTFRLMPWQRRFVKGAVLAPGVHLAALSMARGGGKTSLAGMLIAAALSGPWPHGRGQIVIAAGRFRQARIALQAAKRALGVGQNRARYRVWDTAAYAILEDRHTGAEAMAIGSTPDGAHGLQPALIVADEPARWGRAAQDDGGALWAALRTSLGKHPGSRAIAMGTMPKEAGHWFAKLFEKGGCDYAQLHRAPLGSDALLKANWAKACPSVKHMPGLAAAYAAEAAMARRDASERRTFEALRANWGGADVEGQPPLLEPETLVRIEGDAPREGRPIFGIDLGGRWGFSAVAAYWRASGRVECFAAVPSVPGLAERGMGDGVGGAYLAMHERKELVLLGEHAVPVGELWGLAVARYGLPEAVVADKHRAGELMEALGEHGGLLVHRRMGFISQGEDIRLMRNAAAFGRLVIVPNLALTTSLAEAVTANDAANNEKVVKRRARSRDDIAVSMLIAVAEGERRRAGGTPTPFAMVL